MSADRPFLRSIADADIRPYWLDSVGEPEDLAMLVRSESTQLGIVGGGYAGLWSAILAKERNPERDVVLIDADSCGWGASGRNGGFADASLTHGIANGHERFRSELPVLERMGLRNLNEIESTLQRYGVDCDFERNGTLDVATAPHQLRDLNRNYQRLRQLGQSASLMGADQTREEVHSMTYLGGLYRPDRAAMVDPAKLAWGLKKVALDLGVRIYEDTRATGISRDGVGVLISTPLGRVRCEQAILATNAFKPLLRRLKHYIVPVYDYCMVTEPLSETQLASIGWKQRQGLSDFGNFFHYYRLTADNRILWGGYDAVYYFASEVNPLLEERPETWARLAEHFFQTFPQLEGIQFTHLWGGVIDTCSRYCVFWKRALGGRVVATLGFTGLGVASTRFAANTSLDLLDDTPTERTRLDFVKSSPVPWPPEPFRYVGIEATKWSLARADRSGKRNLWLKGLDRLGMGFDS